MQQMQFLLSILLIFFFLPHAASLAKPTPIDNGTPDALTKQTTHHLAQSETANDFKTLPDGAMQHPGWPRRVFLAWQELIRAEPNPSPVRNLSY